MVKILEKSGKFVSPECGNHELIECGNLLSGFQYFAHYPVSRINNPREAVNIVIFIPSRKPLNVNMVFSELRLCQ